ncbi:MAG: hypothetical protein AB7E73_02735 [Burkholderiales bacterium]
MNPPNNLLMYALGTLLIIAGVLAVATLVHYSGSVPTLAFFHACFLLLLVLTFPRPRMYFYTFFAAFLFLGFWPKVVMQIIWAVGFIEPVGDFSGSPAEWDNALQAAGWGAAGVMLARLIQLALCRRQLTTCQDISLPAPAWFARHRRWIWPATLILIVALNALNLQFAFFQIGVNPQLILPMKLNVLIAWLINVGFAFWIAALVHWEFALDQPSQGSALLAPIAEAFFASVCTLSRLTYLLHTAPYWVAIWEKWGSFRNLSSHRRRISLFSTFCLLFAASVYAVFWLRVNIYYYIPPEDSVATEVHRTMVFQLPNLFIQRWVGLEGTLVVSAVPTRNKELLVEVLTSNPKLGTKSLYQQLAKVRYHSEDPGKFTFLANTGVVAILLFSGSLAVVFLGMALVTALLMIVEICMARLLANDFLQAVAGASLANVIAQTTFPYLTLIFFLQMCVAIAFLAWLQRARMPRLPLMSRTRT